MSQKKPKGLDKAVLGHWIDKLEAAMFPHQESEFEQESFTDVGRERVGGVLQELVVAVRRAEREASPRRGPAGAGRDRSRG